MTTLISEDELSKIELEEGILMMTSKVSIVDIAMAQQLVEYRIESIKGQKYPTIINLSNLKLMTKEARDFLAKERASEGVTAAVILVNSNIESMIGNFFIRISKPLVPTKLYTTEKKARKWLLQFVTN